MWFLHCTLSYSCFSFIQWWAGPVDDQFEYAAANSLEDALKQLYLIDAIDQNGSITNTGRIMAGTMSI